MLLVMCALRVKCDLQWLWKTKQWKQGHNRMSIYG